MEALIYVKHHASPEGQVMAACDKDILGKKFVEGELAVTAMRSFYEGILVTDEQFTNMLKTANNVNLLGERCIALAKECGLLEEGSIRRFDGVPHALLYIICG